jgi:hypothetical protein
MGYPNEKLSHNPDQDVGTQLLANRKETDCIIVQSVMALAIDSDSIMPDGLKDVFCWGFCMSKNGQNPICHVFRRVGRQINHDTQIMLGQKS